MKALRRRALGVLLLCATAILPMAAGAEPPATIRAIVFEGNETTRPATLLRELVVHVGDPADPGRIERSRQAIQDLGLFQSVTAGTRQLDGGVEVLFRVKEKFYLIPAPRADANSDGQYAYGVQLRWYNAFGLNHTLKVTAKRENRQEADHGAGYEFDASYYAPFLFDTPYGLDLSYANGVEPVDTPVTYDERRQSARAVVFRAFHPFGDDGPASRGLRLGAGLQFQDVDNRGTSAPPSPGEATALVLNAGYNNVRYNIYSEAGQRADTELQLASEDILGDYDLSVLVAHYDGSWYYGDTPHQSVGIFAEAGSYHGGAEPREGRAFELGGVGDLRGYRHNFLYGDSYYYAGVETLRPLYWSWLRGVVWFEAGNAFTEYNNFTAHDSYADIGVGVRIRPVWFVKFEANIGYAWPLVDAGDGMSGRFFATGRR